MRALRLESLEDRCLLSLMTYANDNWHFLTDNGDGILSAGDQVINNNDTINPGTVTATYGTDGFGTVSTGLPSGSPGSLAGSDTINDAIANTSAAGTVNVAAGTYNERITIGKSLNLLGAQAGVDPTQAGARTDSSQESIITETGLPTPNPDVLVEIPNGVTDVVIDGFTLNGDETNTTADTSVIRAWDDNITVQNNFIDGMYGVLYKGADGLTVHQNVLNVSKGGVTVQPNVATNVTISDNAFELDTTNAVGDESAVYMTAVTGGLIDGNVATGFVNGNGVGGSNLSDIDVTDNTFSGNRKGVNFWGNTTFIDVTGNTLANNSNSGINIKGQDVTISDNTITGNATGVEIARHVIDTLRVSIADNAINDGNGVGILIDNATAMIQGNDLNGNSSAGLVVQNGAVVDAGQAGLGTDFTGLGISSGGNDFSSYNNTSRAYGDSGAAIRNLNVDTVSGPQGAPPDVTAQNNFFSLSTMDVENVVDHDADVSTTGYVDFSSPAPVFVSGTDLIVVGSSQKDLIDIKETIGLLDVKVRREDFEFHTQIADAVDRIIIYGFGGDDHLKVHKNVLIEAFLFGGEGHDHLSGGGGNNVLDGGPGNDHLQGGRDRDLLIGGTGRDCVDGKEEDDVLVAGFTDQDGDLDALDEVLGAWTSGDSYADRVTAVLGLLDVHDDDDKDDLDGDGGLDLFFANLDGDGDKRKADKVSGNGPGEMVQDIS